MEFLFFFPFMVLLLITMLKFASAINGSINQQKAVRSYFFHLLKNNSNLPNLRDLEIYKKDGNDLNKIRMSVLAWRNQEVGPNSYAPCYEMPPFINTGTTETCNDTSGLSSLDKTSSFIRVFTAFGICSTNYLYKGSASGDEYGYQFVDPQNLEGNFCMIGQ